MCAPPTDAEIVRWAAQDGDVLDRVQVAALARVDGYPEVLVDELMTSKPLATRGTVSDYRAIMRETRETGLMDKMLEAKGLRVPASPVRELVPAL